MGERTLSSLRRNASQGAADGAGRGVKVGAHKGNLSTSIWTWTSIAEKRKLKSLPPSSTFLKKIKNTTLHPIPIALYHSNLPLRGNLAKALPFQATLR